MVNIKWIITDDIKNIELEEFNKEWNGIYGYFEVQFNNSKLGYCPNRELYPEEEFDEEIIDWLIQLSRIITMLDDGQEYRFELLSMNLLDLAIIREKGYKISCINNETGELEWQEEVLCKEYNDELKRSISLFIKEIEEKNNKLLKATRLIDLVEFNKSYKADKYIM